MPPFGLLAALLTAASGITAAGFAVDAYFGPRMMPVASMSAGTSTHQRSEASLLGTKARTRFVAIQDTPRAAPAPAKPKAAPSTAKAPPAKKAQPVKDAQLVKAKRPQQAAVQWPWSVFGN